MAFAAARMILKDKRRKASKEDFAPRNRSKVKIAQDYARQNEFCHHSRVALLQSRPEIYHDFAIYAPRKVLIEFLIIFIT